MHVVNIYQKPIKTTSTKDPVIKKQQKPRMLKKRQKPRSSKVEKALVI